MIVYFSGTGNTRWAAACLARALGDGMLDAFDAIRSGEALVLSSDRPWVFASPVYGWQLPGVFTGLLARSRFAGSRDAYFVATCGSDAGAPEAELRALCATMGLTFRGLLEAVMPENYIAMFPVPDEDASARIIRRARPVLEGRAACIRRGCDFPVRRTNPADRIKSTWVNRFFTRVLVRSGPFRAKDTCTGCGACAALCPTANIRMKDGRPLWGQDCIHCMACISHCPNEAIEYGKKSVGKPRWQCPEWEETK